MGVSEDFMKQCLPTKLTPSGLNSIMKCLKNTDDSDKVQSLQKATLRLHIKDKLTDDNKELVAIVENVKTARRFTALMYSNIPELAQFVFKHARRFESQTILMVRQNTFRLYYGGNEEVMVRKFKGSPPLEEIIWYLRHCFIKRTRNVFPIVVGTPEFTAQFWEKANKIAEEFDYELQNTSATDANSLVYIRKS